jgi:hypothetical protein
MCLSCGCYQPDNDHGDNRNITMADLNAAAEAVSIPPGQAASNIADTLRVIRTPAWPNPVSVAMKKLHLTWQELEEAPLWVAEWLEELTE